MTNTPAVMKITKAVRATAPDLFGQPAYFNEDNHQRRMIDQLKALGMTSVVWAIEDLQAKADGFETMAERVEELEDQLEEATERVEELEPYVTFFDNVVQSLEWARGARRCRTAQRHL